MSQHTNSSGSPLNHTSIYFIALVVYITYKIFEPTNIGVHGALLVFLPTALILSLRVSYSEYLQMIFAYWCLLLIYPVLYRLSPVHPLAKFPGPIFARVSKLYFAYCVSRGDSYLIIRDLHRQYGEVVRVGPNELSFNRSSAIRPIYTSKMTCKGPAYDTRTHLDGSTQLDGVRDLAIHAGRRKAWAKAMSPVALKGYQDVIIDKISQLVEELAKRDNERIDLAYWINLFGLDVMSSLIFGRELRAMSEGRDETGILQMIDSGMRAGYMLAQLPWLYALLNYLPGTEKQVKEMQDRAHQFVKHRTLIGSSRRDLYYYLAEEGATTQYQYSHKELLGDGMLALVAGSDTTSSTLSHLLYFLLRHPTYMARLRNEIDIMIPVRADLYDFNRHTQMPFLNACINEAMRLIPAVTGVLQRRILSTTSAIVGEHIVPRNTVVSVHTYSLHRNPLEFSPLPDAFWPDRWLDQETYTLPNGETFGKADMILNRHAFMPFSVGPQDCAGKALAMLELRAVTCALLSNFDIKVDKSYNLDTWEAGIKDYFVTIRGPLPVHVQTR